MEHEGRFFKSRAPLNAMRSPHGGPAILQAGTSPKRRVSQRITRDGIFVIEPNPASAKAYYDDIKSATVNARRRPQTCKVLFGIQPILGGTVDLRRVGEDTSVALMASCFSRRCSGRRGPGA